MCTLLLCVLVLCARSCTPLGGYCGTYVLGPLPMKLKKQKNATTVSERVQPQPE